MAISDLILMRNCNFVLCTRTSRSSFGRGSVCAASFARTLRTALGHPHGHLHIALGHPDSASGHPHSASGHPHSAPGYPCSALVVYSASGHPRSALVVHVLTTSSSQCAGLFQCALCSLFVWYHCFAYLFLASSYPSKSL